MEPKTELLGRTKDWIEIVGKVVLGVLALSYAMGLVMVNLYYSRFGVYSLSLFRLNYVIAGVWVLLPIVFTGLVCANIVLVIYSLRWALPGKRALPGTIKGEELFILMSDSLGFRSISAPYGLLCFFLFITVVVGLGVKGLGITLNVGDWVGLFISSAILTGLVIAAGYFALRHRSIVRTVAVTSFAVMLVVMFTLHISAFARSIYEHIPAHLGGGGPKDVQLLLDASDKDIEFFQRSGLLFDSNSHWTKNTQLLFTTEDEFVLVVKPDPFFEGSTLSIKRDVVKSVLYKGPRSRSVGGGDEWFDEASPSPTSLVTPAQTSPSPDILPSPSPHPY